MQLSTLILHPFIRLGRSLLHRVRDWTKPITDTPPVGALTDITRSRRELILENALLRQQLLVLQRQEKRPKLHWRDRAVIVGLASRVATWKNALLIVKPETVLRWHRELFRWYWRRKSQPKRPVGRPRLPKEQVALLRRMAIENLTWGAERIRGELLKLGLPIAKSTIQRYLKGRRAAGPGSQTWLTFLHNHASTIWACDFLQLHDLWFRDLLVFVIIELSSRRVVHFAVTRHPTEVWVAQQLREATPFGEAPRFLIRDNDRKYGTTFDRIARRRDQGAPHTSGRSSRQRVLRAFFGQLAAGVLRLSVHPGRTASAVLRPGVCTLLQPCPSTSGPGSSDPNAHHPTCP